MGTVLAASKRQISNLVKSGLGVVTLTKRER
jgi:hypothetical protein